MVIYPSFHDGTLLNMFVPPSFRFLSIDTRLLLVLKLRRGAEPLPGLRQFNSRLLYQQPGRFRGTHVLAAPHAHIALSTMQSTGSSVLAAGGGGFTRPLGMSPLVHCELDSDFEQPIEVAFDRRLFSFVTQARRSILRADNSFASLLISFINLTAYVLCLLWSTGSCEALVIECSSNWGPPLVTRCRRGGTTS